MPKPIKKSLRNALRKSSEGRKKAAEEAKSFPRGDLLERLTVKELADEIESIRADLWAVGERLNKLSWALMTQGVKPGTAQETSDDVPF